NKHRVPPAYSHAEGYACSPYGRRDDVLLKWSKSQILTTCGITRKLRRTKPGQPTSPSTTIARLAPAIIKVSATRTNDSDPVWPTGTDLPREDEGSGDAHARELERAHRRDHRVHQDHRSRRARLPGNRPYQRRPGHHHDTGNSETAAREGRPQADQGR